MCDVPLKVKNPQSVLQLIDKGNRNRAVRHTEMNINSSRSHAILQISMEQWPNNGEGGKVIRSKLNFVDLAGSERWNTKVWTVRSHEVISSHLSTDSVVQPFFPAGGYASGEGQRAYRHQQQSIRAGGGGGGTERGQAAHTIPVLKAHAFASGGFSKPVTCLHHFILHGQDGQAPKLKFESLPWTLPTLKGLPGG